MMLLLLLTRVQGLYLLLLLSSLLANLYASRSSLERLSHGTGNPNGTDARVLQSPTNSQQPALTLSIIKSPIYIDIVITLKTPIKFVRDCVDALVRHSPDPNLGLQQRIVFVDDGSPMETLQYVRELCQTIPTTFFCTKTHGIEVGYTWAVEKGINHIVNEGLRESFAVVLLNSDTIVTEGWLAELYYALIANKKTMIVGPLSNAATWQSVPNPQVVDNTAPIGLSIDTIAHAIKRYADESGARPIPIYIINGFCFMFKRELITSIGGFDTKNFGPGYGEEVDFCLRAHKKGYLAQIVPSTYVFHTKTASFPSDEKKELNRKAHMILDSKYKKILLKYKYEKMVARNQLQGAAANVQRLYDSYSQRYSADVQRPSIIFVVTKVFCLGDVVNLLRSVFYLREQDLEVWVQLVDWDEDSFPPMPRVLQTHFPDLSLADRVAVMSVSSHEFEATDMEYTRALRIKADVVVATSISSVPLVKRICSINPQAVPVYLMNDYPVLSHYATGQEHAAFALFLQQLNALRGSVTLLSNSQWVASAIALENPDSKVHQVSSSIDHNLYYIPKKMLLQKLTKNESAEFHVLIRFGGTKTIDQTIVRSIFMLLQRPVLIKFRILNVPSSTYIRDMYDTHQIVYNGEAVPADTAMNLFEHHFEYIEANYIHHSTEMSDLYRWSDMFIDAASLREWSRHRSTLEAFACGCITVLPRGSMTQSIYEPLNVVSDANDISLTFDATNANQLYAVAYSILQNEKQRTALAWTGLKKSREISFEEGALSFLQIVSFFKTGDSLGNDYYLFRYDSFLFAVLVVSVILLGIVYLRPAHYNKK
jgi:GT2 family glycosyltransferase